MASLGQPIGAAGASLATGTTGDAPRRPSLALQPFTWGGLQILPVASEAAVRVAVVPPPMPGLHRTAPFRVREYEQRSRAAVAALDCAIQHALGQVGGLLGDPHRTAQLAADLDLSDLGVPLPPDLGVPLPPDLVQPVPMPWPTAVPAAAAPPPPPVAATRHLPGGGAAAAGPLVVAAAPAAAADAAAAGAAATAIAAHGGMGGWPGATLPDVLPIAAQPAAHVPMGPPDGQGFIEQRNAGAAQLGLEQNGLGDHVHHAAHQHGDEPLGADRAGQWPPGADRALVWPLPPHAIAGTEGTAGGLAGDAPALTGSEVMAGGAVAVRITDPGTDGAAQGGPTIGTAAALPPVHMAPRPDDGQMLASALQHLGPQGSQCQGQGQVQGVDAQVGRPAKRRRVVPSRYQEAALYVPQDQDLPAQVAGGPSITTAVDGPQPAVEPCGMAVAGEQESQFGAGSGASGASGPSNRGRGGRGRGRGRGRGGGPGGRQGQAQIAAELRRQQTVAWWGELTAASGRLESVRAALQAQAGSEGQQQQQQPGPSGAQAGPGAKRRDSRQNRASPSPPATQPSAPSQPGGSDDEWLEQEMTRGEQERQRWLEGSGSGAAGRAGRTRQGGTGGSAGGAPPGPAGAGGNGADVAAAAGGEDVASGVAPGFGGAYGSSFDAAPMPGGDDRGVGTAANGGLPGRPGSPAPAAEAAAERILQALDLLPAGQPSARTQPQGWGAHSHFGGQAVVEQAVPGLGQQAGQEELNDTPLQDEVVLWVVVCGPGQPNVLHEEFLVLGSTRLSELRDMMGCATEDAMREAAEAAAGPPDPVAAEGGAAAGTAAGEGTGAGRGRGRGGRGASSRGRAGRSRGGRGVGRGRAKGAAPIEETPNPGPAAETALEAAAAAAAALGPAPGQEVREQREPAPLPSPSVPGTHRHLVAAEASEGRGVGRPQGGPASGPSVHPTSGAGGQESPPPQGQGHRGELESIMDPSTATGSVAGHGDAGQGAGRETAEDRRDQPPAGVPSDADAGRTSPPAHSPLPLVPQPPPLLPPSHGSYFFLEGRFFRDVRHPDAEDYSEPVRALCRSHGVRPTIIRPERSWRPNLVYDDGTQVPPPVDMHITCFLDIPVRQANHPIALFCHRACCEHLVFLRDVRRWHPADPAGRSAYPHRLRRRDRAGVPLARRRCGLCEANFAELVTHDDPLAPTNPAIMCRRCFDQLHVGSNGERIAPSVVVQPYNPALDIATQAAWASTVGTWPGPEMGLQVPAQAQERDGIPVPQR